MCGIYDRTIAECDPPIPGMGIDTRCGICGRETKPPLICPNCGEEVWDYPFGHKLAKCWNTHESTGGTLAFDTMEDE